MRWFTARLAPVRGRGSVSSRLFALALFAAGGALGSFVPAHAQDAVAGKQVFEANCRPCHSARPNRNRVGPTLFGIVGRKAGSISDFYYTDAMRNSSLVWTPEQLLIYVGNPHKVVPGTRMSFPGLRSDTDKKNLIAFLETLHN